MHNVSLVGYEAVWSTEQNGFGNATLQRGARWNQRVIQVNE